MGASIRAVLLSLALCASAVLVAPLARADAVPPAPEDCPAGARGSTCHGIGAHCAPKTCTADSDCQDGETCQDAELCLDEGTCGGLMPPDAAPPPPTTIVTGVCPGGGGCTAPATCQTRKVCAAPGTASGDASGDTGSDSGCSCRAGAGDAAAGALALILVGAAIAMLAGRRRD